VATPLDALAGVPNAAQPLPRVLTGGQPGPGHLAALAAAGGEVVLDVRDPMEPRPFDEPAAVRSAGMEYVNVPVGHAGLDDALMERVLEVVRANAGRTLLFHCASGNRVAGPMIAHLMLDHGMDEEQAVAAGMRMGLRGADVLEWGLDYARRHGG
jgi:protein tyrosine phosphatase (PTP) superfamily phosphohydrolase (DUF442 family)